MKKKSDKEILNTILGGDTKVWEVPVETFVVRTMTNEKNIDTDDSRKKFEAPFFKEEYQDVLNLDYDLFEKNGHIIKAIQLKTVGIYVGDDGQVTNDRRTTVKRSSEVFNQSEKLNEVFKMFVPTAKSPKVTIARWAQKRWKFPDHYIMIPNGGVLKNLQDGLREIPGIKYIPVKRIVTETCGFPDPKDNGRECLWILYCENPGSRKYNLQLIAIEGKGGKLSHVKNFSLGRELNFLLGSELIVGGVCEKKEIETVSKKTTCEFS